MTTVFIIVVTAVTKHTGTPIMVSRSLIIARTVVREWRKIMSDGFLIKKNGDGFWDKYNAYTTIVVETEADFNDLQKRLELSERMKWVPCSERLPEKPEIGEDSYIVQKANVRTPFSAYWDGENWSNTDNDILKNIIAWMPLPQPYKGE